MASKSHGLGTFGCARFAAERLAALHFAVHHLAAILWKSKTIFLVRILLENLRPILSSCSLDWAFIELDFQLFAIELK